MAHERRDASVVAMHMLFLGVDLAQSLGQKRPQMAHERRDASVVAMQVLFLGVDLAWGEGTATRLVNETGLVCINGSGEVLGAGWSRGLDDTLAWIAKASAMVEDVLISVDAPLIVTINTGQRVCERQVGQQYGRWHVSANTTNTGSPRQAGVRLLRELEARGFSYTDGFSGPPEHGRRVFECYPYTTLVGAHELGYDVERPRYKRKPKALRTAQWRACPGPSL